MTLQEFKKHCETKRKGDFILPTDNESYTLGIQEALEDIATIPKVIALKLITSDNSNEVLKPINKDLFIRKPIAPKTDEDKIDIDEGLCFAVLYSFLSSLTKDLQKFQIFQLRKEEIINNYIWNNYIALQEIEAKR